MNIFSARSLLPPAILALEQERLVRLIEAPVPHLLHLVAIDVSVRVRRDEDALYASRPDLHRALPRGLCFIVDHEAQKVVCVLAGLRKFTYEDGLTDEQRRNELTTWVFTTKSNGEACHVAAFHDRIAGPCMVSGSKNVHCVFRVATRELFDADLAAYNKQDCRRYMFAVAMTLHLVDTKWEALTRRALPALTASGQTLCLESCRTESLHLVHYETSRAFAFALTDYACVRTCCDPVALVATVHGEWGMDALEEVREVDARDLEQVAAVRRYFYELPNSEGAVVYALDAQRRVLAAHKWKNFHYAFWRAVREKVRGDNGCTAQAIVARLSYPPYHALHPDGLVAHTALVREALDFRAFYRMQQGAEEKKDEEVVDHENDWDASGSQWVALRHAFDRLTAEERAVFVQRNTAKETEEQDAADEASAAAAGNQVQVVFIAVPGAGKSVIGRALVHLVRQAGSTATYIDQDGCGGTAGAYHAAAKKATATVEQGKKKESKKGAIESKPPVDLVVFAKCHGSVQIRDNLRAAIQRQRLVYIVMYHSDDNNVGGWGEHMRDACIRNITARGTNHLTLSPDTPNMAGIVASHVSTLEQLEPRELRLASAAPIMIDIKAPTTLVQHLDYIVRMLLPLLPATTREHLERLSSESLHGLFQQAVRASLDDEAQLVYNPKKAATKQQQHAAASASSVVNHHPGHYWCIKLDEASVANLVQASGRDSGNCNTKMHVTLYYPGKDASTNTPDVYRPRAEALDALVGQPIDFVATRIVCDENAVAAQVTLPGALPFVGSCPHVTLWTSHGTKPVYAGQLCALPSVPAAFMPLANMRLSGTLVRV